MKIVGRSMGKYNSLYHFDENVPQEISKDQCHFFDYNDVDNEQPLDFDPCEMERLGELLREVLIWLSMGDLNSQRYKDTVVRKVISMCWVLRPEIFNGMPLSDIATKKGIGMHRQSLSKQAINFSKRFNIKGRGQRKKHECN